MTDAYNSTAVPGSGFSLGIPPHGCYITVRDDNVIIDRWSDAQQKDRELTYADILVHMTRKSQFCTSDDGPENEAITMHTEYGDVYLYKWVKNREVVRRTDAEIAADAEALRLAKLPGEIREKRNRLLDEADKMRFPWRTMTDAKREEWVEYMQELKDLPEQPGFPEAVIWPVEPE
jgi:hypothetical protein